MGLLHTWAPRVYSVASACRVPLLRVRRVQFSTMTGPAPATDTTQRLAALRALFKGTNEEPIDAILVPHEDSHMSEYPAHHFERLAFISGFTGSAGSAIITEKTACLWTDGRYHLQAAQQLDGNWTLMKAGLEGVQSEEDYMLESLPPSAKIGVDPYLISYDKYIKYQRELKHTNHRLVPLWTNPIDQIWENRPPLPKDKIFVLDNKYTGMEWQAKIGKVREQMRAKHCDALVASCLDETAWLLNLRGADVDYNPVFYAYTLVTADKVVLYVDEEKLDDQVRTHLSGVEVKPYAAIRDDLIAMVPTLSRLWLGLKCNYALASQVPKSKVFCAETPMGKLKAIKTAAELQGAKSCQVRDGAALCSFFVWLERQLAEGKVVDEVDAADYLESMRREQAHFITPSFASISSMGPNGAIIHYSPSRPTAAQITRDSMYLIDSGGQYLDGTTDTTRTLHFGTPTEHQIRCYTLVLKGHISLATLVFPNGTSGHRIDALARQYLWAHGLDYLHGTGHGVGAFLNVHEGPHRITQKYGGVGDYPLQVGMITSNEPGYYEAGHFGVRIENLMAVVQKSTPHNFNNIGFLGFDTTTVVPYARNLIDVAMLTSQERAWVDTYHAHVRDVVGPLLKEQGKADVLSWLEAGTAPL
eukprot:comp23288_c0_seq1/m.38193 comp23288_c0_seq1/g.38193  ORF comp23288_c0_seq1/g.38193 comp23288_c0_seq1/m.38193 type:complete len:643 (-) comp23288_c0_seq1:90-2018(-)